MNTREILSHIPDLRHLDSGMFLLMAGPCVVENETMLRQVAETACRITERLRIPYIFKASYRKANRSRIDSFSGIGDLEALRMLGAIRKEFGVPVVTDIHNPEEAAMAAEYVDVLQIPAFLCRQTDLLVAAAKTGKAVNIKKGQFLSPEAMAFAAGKVRDAGNPNILLTDRGTMFGYHDLIVDMRSIPSMQTLGLSGRHGHYALASAAQSGQRSHREPSADDRNDRPRVDCGGGRRDFHRDASRSVGRQKRRSEYARARTARGTSRTAVPHPDDDQRAIAPERRRPANLRSARNARLRLFIRTDGGPADDTKHSETFPLRGGDIAEALRQLLIKSQQIGPNDLAGLRYEA